MLHQHLDISYILWCNVQSLVNNMDELGLQITTHKRIMDCNVMIFMETWLNSCIPNSAIELPGCYILRADTTANDSRKTRGGAWGLCIYVSKGWCTDNAIERHDSANLEFTTVVTAAYTPLDVNTKLAMKEL